ncbi:FMN-dependent NADH-azoreductase [Jannaschia sp. LMIT008]|uniref:FMN-dependent NADH-azoreductase n=1 Tax=Jannaschia maritima TaxID=3032585 RepID=UPI0028127917|nr:NAD(P)H-dependent oxidoreductase [Jannaschia sp. LMIT008]
MAILRIDSSAKTEGSVSSQLLDLIEARLDGDVTRRDVGDNPLPVITGTWVSSNFTPAEKRTEDQKKALAESDALIAEIQAADTLLIALPVYNFTVPAALKAWIDLICRAGVTFKYTENGPIGLLEGKRAVIAMASGGTAKGGPVDYASPYLSHIMNFIGITDVQIVAADGQSQDADAAMARAKEQIEALAL